MSSHVPPGDHTKYDPDADLPQQPDLSVKEQNVFHWMLQGKRDTEIAILTDANPRTTEKHARCSVESTGRTMDQRMMLWQTSQAATRQ
ncbi:MAG: hypothetical protein ABI946_12515 [Chthoniobacterales bacterium]